MITKPVCACLIDSIISFACLIRVCVWSEGSRYHSPYPTVKTPTPFSGDIETTTGNSSSKRRPTATGTRDGGTGTGGQSLHGTTSHRRTTASELVSHHDPSTRGQSRQNGGMNGERANTNLPETSRDTGKGYSSSLSAAGATTGTTVRHANDVHMDPHRRDGAEYHSRRGDDSVPSDSSSRREKRMSAVGYGGRGSGFAEEERDGHTEEEEEDDEEEEEENEEKDDDYTPPVADLVNPTRTSRMNAPLSTSARHQRQQNSNTNNAVRHQHTGADRSPLSASVASGSASSHPSDNPSRTLWVCDRCFKYMPIESAYVAHIVCAASPFPSPERCS